jgi:hypothetical protein
MDENRGHLLPLPDEGFDFPWFREPAHAGLGEDLPIVHHNLVDATRPCHQSDIGAKLLPELGFQTGSAGQVVSLVAVSDCGFHGFPSLDWSVRVDSVIYIDVLLPLIIQNQPGLASVNPGSPMQGCF